jgi:transketolase
MNAHFGDDIVDHYTYVLAGDGCLMEGISQEALSLAGHLKLNKLILIWDNNSISIDGSVSLSDSTDQLARFAASGWNTLACDGHDAAAIENAIEIARKSDRPTLIAAKTTIGFGAPTKAGTNKVHGSPLGKDEIAATRKALGWDYPPFEVPSDVLDAWRLTGLNAAKARGPWEKRLSEIDADQRSNSSAACAANCPAGSTRRSSTTRQNSRPRSRRWRRANRRKWRWRSSTASCRKPSAARPT